MVTQTTTAQRFINSLLNKALKWPKYLTPRKTLRNRAAVDTLSDLFGICAFSHLMQVRPSSLLGTPHQVLRGR